MMDTTEAEVREVIERIKVELEDKREELEVLRDSFDDSDDDYDDEDALRALENEVNQLDKSLLAYPENWVNN